MKILLIGHDDNGGGSWFTASAINRHTEHEARQYRTHQNYLDYPYHKLKPPEELCREWVRWADVIHARGTLRPLPGKRWTNGKPVVMTYSGNNWRLKTDKLLRVSKGRGDVITVSTWDLPFYAPGEDVVWLPNPREDMAGCAQGKRDTFTVCHAPTDRSWKGTETLIEALDGLEGVDLELVERTTYGECLQRKARCHLVVDQFSYGYGNNGIEGWALGIPVVGDVAGNPGYPFPGPVDLTRFFFDLCGYLPFVRTPEDVAALRETVTMLRDNERFYQEAVDKGRAFFFTYHHAPVAARRAVEVYERALDRDHGQGYAPLPVHEPEAPNIHRQRELNILSLATWDYAGCGYFLSEAINRVTHHHARHVLWQDCVFQFPHDVFSPAPDELRALWKWADVVHIHDAVGLREWWSEQHQKNLHDRHPAEELLIASLPPKPTVITYHGARYRKDTKKHNEEAGRNGWLATCSTLDMTAYGPRWLPDCRPDLSRYVNRPPGRFIVCQAPSNRHTKDTAIVMRAMEGFDFDLVENIPWQECVKRKGRASVYIDQFKLGYGCNSIEAWSMGMPAISNSEVPSILDLLRRHIGYLPFVPCPAEPQAIRETVEHLRDDRRFYREAVERGQDCYHRFYAPEAATRQALAYYREAILRGPAVIVARATATIRYVGKGEDTAWIGPKTGTRYHFRGTQMRHIYAADVPGLLARWRDRRPQFEVVRW